MLWVTTDIAYILRPLVRLFIYFDRCGALGIGMDLQGFTDFFAQKMRLILRVSGFSLLETWWGGGEGERGVFDVVGGTFFEKNPLMTLPPPSAPVFSPTWEISLWACKGLDGGIQEKVHMPRVVFLDRYRFFFNVPISLLGGGYLFL